jgi:predicted DNA-binding protein
MAKKTTKPKNKVTFIRLPLEVHEKAVELAAKDNRNLSNMLSVLVREAIEARKSD